MAVRLHEDERAVGHDRASTTRPSSRWAGRWPRATATRPSSRRTCTSPTATRSTGCTARHRIFTLHLRAVPAPRRRPSGATTTRTTRRSPRRPRATGRRSCSSSTGPTCPYAALGAATSPRVTAGRCSTTSRSTAAGCANAAGTDTATARPLGGRRTRSHELAAGPSSSGRRSRGPAPWSPGRPPARPADAQRRRRRHDLDPEPADPAPGGPGGLRQPDVPLLPSPTRASSTPGRRVPGHGRGRGRDAGRRCSSSWATAWTATRRGASASVSLADWAGQSDPPRDRGGRRRRRQPRRGRRGRHPDPPALTRLRSRATRRAAGRRLRGIPQRPGRPPAPRPFASDAGRARLPGGEPADPRAPGGRPPGDPRRRGRRRPGRPRPGAGRRRAHARRGARGARRRTRAGWTWW